MLLVWCNNTNRLHILQISRYSLTQTSTIIKITQPVWQLISIYLNFSDSTNVKQRREEILAPFLGNILPRKTSQYVFLMTSWAWKTRCQYLARVSPSTQSPAGTWETKHDLDSSPPWDEVVAACRTLSWVMWRPHVTLLTVARVSCVCNNTNYNSKYPR